MCIVVLATRWRYGTTRWNAGIAGISLISYHLHYKEWRKNLVKKLLDLFELLRSELSGVYTLNFPSEVNKMFRDRARRERKGFNLDGHLLLQQDEC